MTTAKTKVLHLIHSVNPTAGGTVEALMQLLRCSVNTTMQHEVVCLDDPDEVSSFGHSATIHALGPTKRFYGKTPQLDKWLDHKLTDYSIAVIHGCWQYHGLAGFRFCKKYNIPYVQYTHGMLDPWFKKQYPLKHLKKWLYWPWAEYRILKNASRVIFTCEEEQRLSHQSFWLYNVKPEVIPLGIQPPNYDFKSCEKIWLQFRPELKGKQTLLFLSRIHEKKGVDDLLEAVSIINNNPTFQNNKQVSLVIAGPCHQPDYLNQLKTRASKINLNENTAVREIVWVEMIKDEIKWGAIAHADAFILPSHQENFGMVIPEALACGTPVLISDKVNIWKEISRNDAGIVETDGVEGTTKLLEKWLTLTDEDKQALTDSAYRTFQNEFAIHKNADRVFELLKNLISYEKNTPGSV